MFLFLKLFRELFHFSVFAAHSHTLARVLSIRDVSLCERKLVFLIHVVSQNQLMEVILKVSADIDESDPIPVGKQVLITGQTCFIYSSIRFSRFL